MQRRHFLATSALPLIGCHSRNEMRHEIEGGFEGISLERGHLLRDRKSVV